MSEKNLPKQIKVAFSESGSFNIHCRAVKGNDCGIFIYGIPNSLSLKTLGTVIEEYFGEIDSFKDVTFNLINPSGTNKTVSGQYPCFFEHKGYEFTFKDKKSIKQIISSPRIFVEATPIINRLSALSKSDLAKLTSLASDYEAAAQSKRDAISKMRGSADADGWIKVTSGGKHSTVASPDGTTHKIISKEEAQKYAKNKKEVIYSDFYTHQKKQQQMDKLSTLRAKFNQDKALLEEMKKKRREYFTAE